VAIEKDKSQKIADINSKEYEDKKKQIEKETTLIRLTIENSNRVIKETPYLSMPKRSSKLQEGGTGSILTKNFDTGGDNGFDLPFQIGSEKGDTKLSKAQEFWNSYGQIVAQGVSSIGDIMTNAHNLQMEQIDRETQAKISAVESSHKSEKQKAKEIKKIQEEAQKESQKIRMKEWKAQVDMSIAQGAMAVLNTLASPIPVSMPAKIGLAIAVGALSGVQTGIIMSNKPKFYYGSRDAAGQYSEIGGNSAGDNIDARVRSGELIVKAGRDASIAKNALNGNISSNQIVSIGGVSVNISGNADQNAISQIPSMIQKGVAMALENRRFTNNFNPALV